MPQNSTRRPSLITSGRGRTGDTVPKSTGDAALGFFVDRAWGSGKSWVEISAVLGVSKQAAHKRFADSWTSKPAFNRYTHRAMAVVKAAADVARERNHDYIGTEHLLLAFYTQPESPATKALLQHGLAKKILLGQGLDETAAWSALRALLEEATK